MHLITLSYLFELREFKNKIDDYMHTLVEVEIYFSYIPRQIVIIILGWKLLFGELNT